MMSTITPGTDISVNTSASLKQLCYFGYLRSATDIAQGAVAARVAA
jgi:hypothetical protein